MTNNPHPIEYQMTKAAFDNILKTRNDAEKKLNPFAFVMNVLNTQNGLRGTVKKIHIVDGV